jgi:hypothetical protein
LKTEPNIEAGIIADALSGALDDSAGRQETILATGVGNINTSVQNIGPVVAAAIKGALGDVNVSVVVGDSGLVTE